MRILFVDDEPAVLAGLRRLLRLRQPDWQLTFAESGREAVALLQEQTFDVVVSDMRMPGMDGAEVLEEVRRHQADAIRIILSGHAERDSVMRALAVAHEFVAKPCDPADLATSIVAAQSR